MGPQGSQLTQTKTFIYKARCLWTFEKVVQHGAQFKLKSEKVVQLQSVTECVGKSEAETLALTRNAKTEYNTSVNVHRLRQDNFQAPS